MSCTDFDVRDYSSGGAFRSRESPRLVSHFSSCSHCCTAELDNLRHLRFALESLPDQEPPQRIGFVSDKIFEPSRARRLMEWILAIRRHALDLHPPQCCQPLWSSFAMRPSRRKFVS